MQVARTNGSTPPRPCVLAVVGTRPEAIKLAPVIRALESHGHLDSIVCATGQHRDMLDDALTIFGITPDVDLDVMQPNQQLAELQARVLQGVTTILRATQPDLVLVQGDTTTAMATATAAFYQRIPVGHVEAGLRTGDMANPFPEEMNRKVISTLASLHFAPTHRARSALLAEGLPRGSIFVTGNTVIDALYQALESFPASDPPARRQILVTAHRRESFGAPFDGICTGLRLIALRHPEVDLVYPVHRNPSVRRPVHRFLSDLPNVQLVEPLDYREFLAAMRAAYMILTDSGGVQEEAPSLGKPILILRDTTERPEVVEVGAARLVGTNPERIVAECDRLLADSTLYGKMASAPNPFGDGGASARIVAAIADFLDSPACRLRRHHEG